MEYMTTFLEGIITFISPCLLPMLPIYLSYFAGGQGEEKKSKAIINSLAFVMGFTVVFTLLGVFSQFLGSFLIKYQSTVHIVLGAIVVILGLQYLGVFSFNLFNKKGESKFTPQKGMNLFKSFLFGIVFSISWTPCVGAFLGAALAQASQAASMGKGVLLLLFYSLGLGIPFMLSALLLEQLQGAFTFIKKHYTVIRYISGGFLIVIGILMMTGIFFNWVQQLSSLIL